MTKRKTPAKPAPAENNTQTEAPPDRSHVSASVQCDNCGDLHFEGANSYITFHGPITIGENKAVTDKPIRLCFMGQCRNTLAELIQNANPSGPDMAFAGIGSKLYVTDKAPPQSIARSRI